MIRLFVPIVLGTLLCGAAHAGVNVWTNSGPGGGRVLCVAADPTNPGTVYAGTAFGGLFKSVDGGANWSAANTGLPLGGQTLGLTTIWAIAVDPNTPSIVYAGTGAGVFKSTNAGASWQAANTGLVGPPGSAPAIAALGIDPQVPAILYAAASVWGGGLFKSINGGASWFAAHTGIFDAWGSPAVVSLVIDPLDPANLYAATLSSVVKSINGAGNWLPLSVSAGDTNLRRLAIDPSAPSTVYVGTDAGTPNGVLKTTDGGATWNPVNTGLPGPTTVNALAVDPTAPGTVYVAANNCTGPPCASGVYRSPDRALNWTATALAGSSDYAGAYAIDTLAVAPTHPSTIYAADSIDGLLRSADAGANWTDSNSGMANTLTVSLALDPSTPATVYAATYEGSVFKSTDRGATWLPRRAGLPRFYGLAPFLAVAPTNANTLFAGTQRGVFRSLDSGASWHAASAGLPANAWVTSVAVDPSNASTGYAGAHDCETGPCTGGLHKTSDGGDTWAPTALSGTDVIVEGITIDPTMPATLYVSARDADQDGVYLYNGVYRSTDGGVNWERRSPELVELSRVVIDPTLQSTLYVTGRAPGGPTRVFKSTDSGFTWSPIDVGLPANVYPPIELAIDPANASNLYAATDSGIFRSTDAGVHWTALDNGLTQAQFTAIAVDPFTPAVVYAASAGGGVFVMEQVPATHGIGGSIHSYNRLHAVGGVVVDLQGTPPASQVTDSAGQYAFVELTTATSTVSPRKDGDFGTGISALDAVFVLQSVAGLRMLDANQRLAADVTGNGSISALDAARILQKAVGAITRLPLATTCNSDWLFVPTPAVAANQQIFAPVISSGVCQPGAITYDPLAASATGQDFLAILIGDVTGNWVQNSGAAAALKAEAKALTAGVRLGRARPGSRSRLRVPVYAAPELTAATVDFTVTFDPAHLRLRRIRRGPQMSGALIAHHSGTPGSVRIAMASATPLPPAAGILVLEFEGNATAPLRISGSALADD